ncbi:TPA: ATP-binding protein [Candidatus Woesearchaeota archaeon]|nr:ATP-binding protein [Candidatus Woesearchaeota archaeon]
MTLDSEIIERKGIELEAKLNSFTYQITPQLAAFPQVYEAVKHGLVLFETTRESCLQNAPPDQAISAAWQAAAAYVTTHIPPGILNRPYRVEGILQPYPRCLHAVLESYSRALKAAIDPSQITYSFFSGIGEQAGDGVSGMQPLPIIEPRECSWDSIGGYHAAKKVFRDLVFLISHLDDALGYAAKEDILPRGILLAGPPGTGKSSLATIAAQQAAVPYEHIGANNFSEYVNRSAMLLQHYFDRAAAAVRAGSPAYLLMIDEIDAMGMTRSDHAREDAKVMSILLKNMDGAHTPGVIVVGTTNRSDAIDPALRRRFLAMEMGLPDDQERAEIFQAVIKRKQQASSHQLFEEIDHAAMAKATEGWSGAAIAGSLDAWVRGTILSQLQTQRGFPITHDLIVSYLHRERPANGNINDGRDETSYGG